MKANLKKDRCTDMVELYLTGVVTMKAFGLMINGKAKVNTSTNKATFSSESGQMAFLTENLQSQRRMENLLPSVEFGFKAELTEKECSGTSIEYLL